MFYVSCSDDSSCSAVTDLSAGTVLQRFKTTLTLLPQVHCDRHKQLGDDNIFSPKHDECTVIYIKSKKIHTVGTLTTECLVLLTYY